MAEAIARYDAADVLEPSSARLTPLGSIADLTRETLFRNGYSANGLTSDVLTHEAIDKADLIINMTGKPREDNFGNLEKVEDWIVQDPFGGDEYMYQRVFEGIKRRVHHLAAGLREARHRQKTSK